MSIQGVFLSALLIIPLGLGAMASTDQQGPSASSSMPSLPSITSLFPTLSAYSVIIVPHDLKFQHPAPSQPPTCDKAQPLASDTNEWLSHSKQFFDETGKRKFRCSYKRCGKEFPHPCRIKAHLLKHLKPHYKPRVNPQPSICSAYRTKKEVPWPGLVLLCRAALEKDIMELEESPT